MPRDVDSSNGYEHEADEFIARRTSSGIGAETVRAWAASLPPGAAVLDVACGHGLPITQTLIAQGLQVFALDASPTLIDAFRARFPDVPARCETIETSTFFDRAFDAIVAWGVMFLLPPATQPLLIEKAARALRPGGRFLFTAPVPVCEWQDVLTGRTSSSLGGDRYRALIAAAGLTLQDELDDEGDNHYFVATR